MCHSLNAGKKKGSFMKMAVFLDIAPCSLVKNLPKFQAFLLPPSSLIVLMGAESSS
jgi:hypothetical protein